MAAYDDANDGSNLTSGASSSSLQGQQTFFSSSGNRLVLSSEIKPLLNICAPCSIRSGKGHAGYEITSKPISCFQPINLRQLRQFYAYRGSCCTCPSPLAGGHPKIPTTVSPGRETDLISDSTHTRKHKPDRWLRPASARPWFNLNLCGQHKQEILVPELGEIRGQRMCGIAHSQAPGTQLNGMHDPGFSDQWSCQKKGKKRTFNRHKHLSRCLVIRNPSSLTCHDDDADHLAPGHFGFEQERPQTCIVRPLYFWSLLAPAAVGPD